MRQKNAWIPLLIGGAVVYWIGWGLLLVAVVTVVWILFRSPTELGF